MYESVVLFSVMILSSLFIARPVEIKGSAMAPSYKDGQKILTLNRNLDKKIERGSVYIFVAPKNSSIEYIKRVVGLPGETVMFSDGGIYINGEKLEEPYVNGETILFNGGLYEENVAVTIPEDSYFMMGDNRSRSADSREYGPINKSLIKGKALFCYAHCDK